MKYMQKLWEGYCLFFAVAAFAILLCHSFPHWNAAFYKGTVEEVDEGIGLSDATKTLTGITLPYHVNIAGSGTMTITAQIPAQMDSSDFLFLYIKSMNARIYVDGACVGEYDAAGKEQVEDQRPAKWYFVHLKDTDAGKELRIEYTAGEKGYKGWFLKMYSGDKTAIIYELLKQNFALVFSAIVTVIMGILVLGFYLSTMLDKKMPQYIFLGFFMIAAGAQLLITSSVRQIFISNIDWAERIGSVLLLAVCIPFVCYVILIGEKRKELLWKMGFFSFAGLGFLDFILHNVAGLWQFFSFYYLGLLIMCICSARQFISVMEETRREKQVAKKNNEAKTIFLAEMSHAIRTPVNVISGMDTMILKQTSNQKMREYAVDVQSAVNALLAIMDDILDFSKIESGKTILLPVNYSLSSLINDSYNMIVMRAKEKNISFDVENDPEIPDTLCGDEIRIRQILINVLSNAVKYTREGSIEFYTDFEPLTKDSIMLCFRIKDTGIGIKKENLGKIFSSYERMDETMNRGIEGTGLGLSITRKLVALMGGTITVESIYGEGSTFYVRIPQKAVSSEKIGNYSDRIHQPRKAAGERKQWFYAPEAKVLVVDDVEMNLKVINAIFRESGMQVDNAGGGMECLELVKKNAYDLIFMDHMMPHPDGMETFQRMKELADSKNKDTPVIVLTANAVLGAREGYLADGFTDYLSKPVDEAALIRICEKHLAPELLTDPANRPEETEDSKGNTNGIQKDTLTKLGLFLNVEEGLKYSMNKPDFYFSFLQDFIASAHLDALAKHYEANDLDNYRIEVHSIKSLLRTVGADELSERARLLEDAARRQDWEYIHAQGNSFLKDCRNWMDEIRSILNGMPQEDNAELLERPAAEIVNLLLQIKRASARMDLEEAEEAAEAIFQTKMPQEDAAEVEKLKNAYDQLDFEEMEDAAEKILLSSMQNDLTI